MEFSTEKWVDNNPFMNLNITSLYGSPSIHYYVKTITQISKILMSTASLAASILLIYVLYSSTKLRKQHKFVLHYAIASIFNMISVLLFEIASDLLLDNFTREEVLCSIFQVNYVNNIAILYFISAIGLFWFLEIYKPTYAVKYEQYEIYFNLVLVFIFSFLYCLLVYECFTEIGFFSNLLLIVLYTFMLVLIAIAYGILWRFSYSPRQIKRRYKLSLSTLILLSWLPIFIYEEFISMFVWDFYILANVINAFIDCIMNGGPLIVVLFLGWSNKYFRTAYRKIFKKNVGSYQDNDLDSSSDEENSHDDTFVYVKSDSEENINDNTL